MPYRLIPTYIDTPSASRRHILTALADIERQLNGLEELGFEYVGIHPETNVGTGFIVMHCNDQPDEPQATAKAEHLTFPYTRSGERPANEVLGVPDNQPALDKYKAAYNNQTYGAIRVAFTDFGDIFDSPTNPEDHVVTDIMNLATDAALWRCGHSDYVGTRGFKISQAEFTIKELVKRSAPLHGAKEIQAAIDAHLANFPVCNPLINQPEDPFYALGLKSWGERTNPETYKQEYTLCLNHPLTRKYVVKRIVEHNWSWQYYVRSGESNPWTITDHADGHYSPRTAMIAAENHYRAVAWDQSDDSAEYIPF
jgi:hypothetical protein